MSANSSTRGGGSTRGGADYYTPEKLQQLWDPRWFANMFCAGAWFSGADAKILHPLFQAYHPFTCHACKRGPLNANHTKLSTCSRCKVIKYCCLEHQKQDWKAHKTWCKAFTALREEIDMSQYASRQEWHASIPVVCTGLIAKMGGRDIRHATEGQFAIMQPRCRKCYRAGFDPSVELVTCPRCTDVALCTDCLGEDGDKNNHIVFHQDSTDKPLEECDGHLLALCCTGMVVEQGNPLGLPSNTDEREYWNPKDWMEYFARKRSDYELPPPFFLMAPVPCFLSDAHSTMLTVQHVLALPGVLDNNNNNNVAAASHLEEIIIHLCGAASAEINMVGKYVEFTRLNPQLKRLTMRLIGNHVLKEGQSTTGNLQRHINLERIRPGCEFVITAHEGLYHEQGQADDLGAVVLRGERPTMVLCQHAGLSDVSYTDLWEPTLRLLLDQNVPVLVTGYTFNEVLDDTKLLQEWGARILVPPKANPLRGLRPFLNPDRDPEDLIYSNAAFVVVKGTTTATEQRAAAGK